MNKDELCCLIEGFPRIEYDEHTSLPIGSHIEALAEDILALNQSQWQPIETAPNGLVLVTAGRYCVVACRDGGQWFSGLSGKDWHFQVDISPTHWMPLPQGPETDNAD